MTESGSVQLFLRQLGEEVGDPEEETFLLFSEANSSLDLGFVDGKATIIDLAIANKDLTIEQSPGLLLSNRQEGTTGAVVWKVTPLVADWFASDQNALFQNHVLHSNSTVLELGCGISGIIPLILGPKVGRYIATDQAYVLKSFEHNIVQNTPKTRNNTRDRARRKPVKSEPRSNVGDIQLLALDWELDSASSLSSFLNIGESIDVVIACDCIYNEALIPHFVQTCAEACRLQQERDGAEDRSSVCLIAQQLRSDSVFASWLSAFQDFFHVWRVPNDVAGADLEPANGFVMHVGILKTKKSRETRQAT